MLSKCANPNCDARFLHLREGKLFRMHPGLQLVGQKRPLQRIEYFWLCSRCAATMTLASDGNSGVVIVPMPAARAAAS